MKKRIIVAFLVFAVCLMVSSVSADECKKVIAKVGVAVYADECSYNGLEYIWCIDSPVKGNLRGIWHILASPDFNAWELTVPDDVLGIPGWDLWATWNLSVFETKKGDIITAANEVAHLDVYFNYGAISGTALVIGGTGAYEGATGWVGWVVTETGGGELRGEICLP